MIRKMKKALQTRLLCSIFCMTLVLLSGNSLKAQIQVGDDMSDINYNHPVEYEIGGITVVGTQYVDKTVLAVISGLNVGDRVKVPGDAFVKAIRKIWDQG